MIADVNLMGALGSTPGAPPLQESGAAAGPALAGSDKAVDFAALMDEATGAVPVPAPVVVPARAAAAFELPVDATLFTEWWLGASDVTGALHQLREEAARSEEGEAVDEESTEDPADDSNSAPLEGVLNIEWLFARPQRLIFTAPASETSEVKARDGVSTQQAPVPAEAGPHADAATLLAKVGDGKEPEAAAPADAESLVAVAETFEKAVRSAFDPAPAPARKAEQPVPTVEKAERPVADTAIVKAVTIEAASAMTMAAAEGQSDEPAAVQAEPAPRQNQAASRLAKAIERLGGAPAEAAPVVRGTNGPQQESLSDGATRGFSSSHQHEATSATPARAHTGSPVFTMPSLPEVRQSIDVAMASVEMPSTLPNEIPEADTVRQIVQTMRMQFRDGIGDAVVRLRPEHLGEVSISLRVEQGSVSATVQAEVAAVRHWLETHEGTLRSNLAEQGLHLEKFVVREDTAQQQHADAQDQQQKRRSRRQSRVRQHEDQPIFEVTV